PAPKNPPPPMTGSPAWDARRRRPYGAAGRTCVRSQQVASYAPDGGRCCSGGRGRGFALRRSGELSSRSAVMTAGEHGSAVPALLEEPPSSAVITLRRDDYDHRGNRRLGPGQPQIAPDVQRRPAQDLR